MSVAICHTDRRPWISTHLLPINFTLGNKYIHPSLYLSLGMTWEGMHKSVCIICTVCLSVKGPGLSRLVVHGLQSISACSLLVLWGYENRMPWKNRWSGQDVTPGVPTTANCFSLSISFSFFLFLLFVFLPVPLFHSETQLQPLAAVPGI